MISITVIVLLGFLVFYNDALYKFLPKETTTMLKALLPIGVLFHHVNINYGILDDFNQAGYYIVGLFFFVSGYGLEFKISKGEKGVEHLLARIKKLLLPLVVPSLLYISIKMFVYGLSLWEILGHSFEWKIILPYSWFVVVLINLTVFFFLLAGICNTPKKRLLSLFVFIVLFIVVCRLSEVQSTYYVSIPAFWIGAFSHYKKREIEIYMKSPWRYIVFPCLGLSVPLALYPFPFTTSLNVLIYVGGIIVAASCVPEYKFIKKLSSISYEQYLCQGITFAVMSLLIDDIILNNALNSSFVFTVLVVLANILIATICHMLTALIAK